MTVSALIRPVAAADAADLHDLLRHPQVARFLTRLPDLRLEDVAERLRPQPNRHAFVTEVDGRVVGEVVLWQHENPRLAHSGGLGLAVHPDFWGRGIGTALMTAILDLADSWLNLQRVELEVHTDNAAAIHLYEKMGFEREGTKRRHMFGGGRWLDSHLMARLRT